MGYMKDEEFLNWLSGYQLLKKCTAQGSHVVTGYMVPFKNLDHSHAIPVVQFMQTAE
jgi:hypothetical protein